MQNKLLIVVGISLLVSSGFTLFKNADMGRAPYPAFSTEAHRGGRGLMPENTIPAMKNAIDLGMTTLETLQTNGYITDMCPDGKRSLKVIIAG